MNLFLQGRSGVGKSYLLRSVLAPYSTEIAGFIAQRLTENGERTGFRAASVDGELPSPEAEYISGIPDVFVLRGQWNVAALEKAILRVEAEARAPRCKLILLDEIGGIELASAVFAGALKRILSGDTPCAGVFKSRENLLRMISRLGLGEEYIGLHRELETLLNAGEELITVTEQNRDKVREFVSARCLPLFCE